MNREIKFRFWNYYTKLMLKPRSLHDLIASPVPSHCYHNAMQFTDLTDNKGQEIYEGDIVYIGGYGNYEVEFPFTELYDAIMENDIGSILGNIHENPELLEDL